MEFESDKMKLKVKTCTVKIQYLHFTASIIPKKQKDTFAHNGATRKK